MRDYGNVKAPAVCLAIGVVASAWTCLNDRDSLAAEVRRKPDLIWTLVGRFERNPPQFYEMRIEPDVLAPNRTPADFAAGRDPQLKAARELLAQSATAWARVG